MGENQIREVSQPAGFGFDYILFDYLCVCFRETHVHLFIIEDTVEDQICQLITQFKETNGG